MDSQELERRETVFIEGLKRSGIKVTHQRLEIFREAAGSADHPDAETVFRGVRRRLPTVSLDTVYRTLWLLLDLGLITTLGTPRERVRFDSNTSPHHHFICRKCGRAVDFTCVEFDRLPVPPEVLSLGRVEGAQVEVRGICQQCAEK